MAHFALVDDGNVVRDIAVISNSDCGGGDFPASEPLGQAFINGPHPAGLALPGNWLQTSYSGSFRGRFATINGTYDPTLDEFVNLMS
jgi:hypothetical protein